MTHGLQQKSFSGYFLFYQQWKCHERLLWIFFLRDELKCSDFIKHRKLLGLNINYIKWRLKTINYHSNYCILWRPGFRGEICVEARRCVYTKQEHLHFIYSSSVSGWRWLTKRSDGAEVQELPPGVGFRRSYKLLHKDMKCDFFFKCTNKKSSFWFLVISEPSFTRVTHPKHEKKYLVRNDVRLYDFYAFM